jgi:hypothetical protein
MRRIKNERKHGGKEKDSFVRIKNTKKKKRFAKRKRVREIDER